MELKPHLYTLDPLTRTPKPTKDFGAWADWFSSMDNRIVDQTSLCDGTVFVSTIFIGMNTCPFGVPMMFETMIFGGKHDLYQVKCATWDQALKLHEAAIALVRSPTNPTPPDTLE
jgi:hypothetical protein